MNWIKEGRVKKGWTQTDLANKLGVSLQSIWAYENNKSTPRPKKVKILKNLLNDHEG